MKMDLIGVVSPVCLLKCKSVLAGLSAGDMLEILLQDPEVVDELAKFIQPSKDRVISKEREEDHYRICVKKVKPESAEP